MTGLKELILPFYCPQLPSNERFLKVKRVNFDSPFLLCTFSKTFLCIFPLLFSKSLKV